jgi:sulfur carrier protein
VLIVLNGKETQIRDGMTLADFIRDKGLEPDRIVVEHNRQIPEKEDWGRVVLKERDRLEVLRFVGGG